VGDRKAAVSALASIIDFVNRQKFRAMQPFEHPMKPCGWTLWSGRDGVKT
jgi:hypothetical protein